MNESGLFENTKVAAYFFWEHTGCENALDLWLCAEDTACFFEQTEILEVKNVEAIMRLDKYDYYYIAFVQHVSFRIFQYTGSSGEWHNWFAAERLLANTEWVEALVGMASIYRSEKRNQSVMNDVRSENVRAYYEERNQY